MTRMGERIGHYRIDREVPSDGPMALFEATHVVLPRRVLLEVLHPHLVGIRMVSLQMLREACILEALNHPGVPRVFETGVTTDRRPWIAIELVEGTTLDHDIRPTSLPTNEVVDLIEGVAEILSHAHARGIIHRNLRPSAILRGDDERICIVDWSDARTHDTESVGEIDGPDYYRAPEMLCGDSIDGRVDMFALGVVAYEALTGQLPSLPIARRAPSAPAKLLRLIDAMLSIDPTNRPPAFDVCDRAREIRHELEGMAVITDDDAIVQEIEDVVLLVDISREVTEAIPEPVREKPRWTPPWTLADRTPANAGDLTSRVIGRREDTH